MQGSVVVVSPLATRHLASMRVLVGTFYLVSGFFMFALQAATLDAPTLMIHEYHDQFVHQGSLKEKEIHSYLSRFMKTDSQSKIAHLGRLISRLSHKHRLPTGLILSVMRVESGFKPWAVSNQGALGLMQIMPETGEWLAPRCGMNWRGPAMLLDEETNVIMGVTYLAILRDKYNGDLKKMLSAYNRGPAKVDEEVAEGRHLTLAYYHKIRKYQFSRE